MLKKLKLIVARVEKALILWRLGKILPSDFASEEYLLLNPDVRSAGVDPVLHYLCFGCREGRRYKREVSSTTLTECLSEYTSNPPSEQNAFDLFQGSWSGSFDGISTGGFFDGLRDPRVAWLLNSRP